MLDRVRPLFISNTHLCHCENDVSSWSVILNEIHVNTHAPGSPGCVPGSGGNGCEATDCVRVCVCGYNGRLVEAVGVMD